MDPHTGYNKAAANATRKAVNEFVRTGSSSNHETVRTK
jgi:hypothetical protein